MINQEEINKYAEELQILQKKYETICKVEEHIYNDLMKIEKFIEEGEIDTKELESAKANLKKCLDDSDVSKKELLAQINDINQKIIMAHMSI